MKNLLLLSLIFIGLVTGKNTTPMDSNRMKENNFTKKNLETNSKLDENVKKAIAKEKKFKKEQKFYQGKDYNLSEKGVDPASLDKINLIKPDYDYEMLEF